MRHKQIKPSERAEAAVLHHVIVRLVAPPERERWDQEVSRHHYLQHAKMVGEQLR